MALYLCCRKLHHNVSKKSMRSIFSSPIEWKLHLKDRLLSKGCDVWPSSLTATRLRALLNKII